ncbi:ubiquinone biosynthesis regulatory protein kinase UbiB [Thorsellia anophelis]|uniref:Probable protein kinase UbiB n=1 Tax=Thorsellia anophelis DSM 18579 TaxID=1123402 RepID=A0A1H9ZG00_9GAMM|nr:ubiquinone biosynthesis regulatory protein kinase UbiB [Thorsellia anophelis]SES80523.1 2-octaprenylphenol hydroxylase [Thorsellia anophelis DSM 18579]
MFKEFWRLYQIIRVFLQYGLEELIPNKKGKRFLLTLRFMLFWIKNEHTEKQLGERIRLAMQDLGPVWIKLGQMLSTRRDLFSPQIANQLALLQSQVTPFDGEIAKKQIEAALEAPIDTYFENFELMPLASASIAQVHCATLKENGKSVVLKVIRPDIEPIIKADLRLMYRLANLSTRLIKEIRRLKPKEVISEYEEDLFNELNLMREAANAIQIKRNFTDSELLYVPEVYTDYCRENLLVIERISGVPVANTDELIANNVNMKLLAERGVQVFFTQVFRDSFFHADMHPGNIFVDVTKPDTPSYIAIDFGIVGSLNKNDKRYLAENFIAFFNRDYRKVAELHVDSGWVPNHIDIDEFEFSIRTVCEPIFEKPLSEISFGHVLLNLFNTARKFEMQVQPQLVLLQKTLLYIEGLGRQLYPELDLWVTAKPFLENWMKEQVGFKSVVKAVKEKAPFWIETLPELPELFYQHLKQQTVIKKSLEELGDKLKKQDTLQSRKQYWLVIGSVLVLSSVFLIVNHMDLYAYIGFALGLVAWINGMRS